MILLSPDNHLLDLLITFFRYEFTSLNTTLCCVYEGNHTNLLAVLIIFGWLYASYFLSINQHFVPAVTSMNLLISKSFH